MHGSSLLGTKTGSNLPMVEVIYYAPPSASTQVKPKREVPPPRKIRAAQYKTIPVSTLPPAPPLLVPAPAEKPDVLEIPIPADLPQQFVPVFINYYQAIRQRILRYLDYPLIARKRSVVGTVHTSFDLDHRGRLRKLTIEKSSGSDPLDQAALQSIRAATPFPPFPSNLPRSKLTFHIQIAFQLE